MPRYKDVDGNLLTMAEALPKTKFSLTWEDGVHVECTRRGFDALWSVSRSVDGFQAAYGTVTQVDHAFRRNGSQHDYNTFDEAARRIVEPV